MDKFSNRFKELKIQRNITYQQIADYLEVQLRTVKFYASGKIKPNFYGLIALADYFDVSIDYLVGRSNDPKRY